MHDEPRKGFIDMMCEVLDDVVGDRLVVLTVLIAALLLVTGIVPGLFGE